MFYNEELLIKAENEGMQTTDYNARVLLFDYHEMHIKAHVELLSNPEITKDNQLVIKIMEHIQDHIKYLSPEAQKMIQWNNEMKEVINES